MRHIYSNNSSAKLILIQHICMDVITGHLDIKSIHFVFKPTSPMSCVMKCIQRGDIQKNGQKCAQFAQRLVAQCRVLSHLRKQKKYFYRGLYFRVKGGLTLGQTQRPVGYIAPPSLTMLKEDLPSTHIKPLSIPG